MPIVPPAGPILMDFLFALCVSEHIVCRHLVLQEAIKQLPSSQGMNNTYDSWRVVQWGAGVGRHYQVTPKAWHAEKQPARWVRKCKEKARRKHGSPS